MLDNTSQLSRSYSAKLDAQYHAARERSFMACDIADQFKRAWLSGGGKVERLNGTDTLAGILLDDFCDRPGNALHDLLGLVRELALAEDAAARKLAQDHAIALIDAMSWQHGSSVAEAKELA